MKKPAIPAIPVLDTSLYNLLTSIKENIELTNGTRTGYLDSLSSSATTAQIISKINEIVDRLNGK